MKSSIPLPRPVCFLELVLKTATSKFEIPRRSQPRSKVNKTFNTPKFQINKIERKKTGVARAQEASAKLSQTSKRIFSSTIAGIY